MWHEVEECEKRFGVDPPKSKKTAERSTVDLSDETAVDSSNKDKKEYEFQNIKSKEIDGLSYDELERICFHYSPKENEADLDSKGIISRIGPNSDGIDEKEAIYFAYGVEGGTASLGCVAKMEARKTI